MFKNKRKMFRNKNYNNFFFMYNNFYLPKLKKLQLNCLKTVHLYHLVDPNPWLTMAAYGAFLLTTGSVLYMHKYTGGWNLLIIDRVIIIFVMFVWWRDNNKEAPFGDKHNAVAQKVLRLGIILFVLLEIMYFFAFFHSNFSIGAQKLCANAKTSKKH